MTTLAHVSGVRGAVSLDALSLSHGSVPAVRGVSFLAAPREVLTLLGPSGCGKTTTLRAIAGLETPQHGRIMIDGRAVYDASCRINLPPEQRGLSMVFQSYAIWPHMTVAENVAFGLRARGVGKARLHESVRRCLDLVGLGALADRPATRLSGGQQQRVALARSIAGDPGVILLDEPLSNLDAQLRLAMRTELRALQRRLGLTAIYVTHDQEEALALSDQVAVMREGTIEQIGTPQEIHASPCSRFVAEFMGVRNVIPCQVIPHGGGVLALLPDGTKLQARGPIPTGPVCVCFRPISVQIRTGPDGGRPAVVSAAAYLGDLMQYELQAGDLSICARSLPRDDLREGATVYWSVPPEACFLVSA